MIRGTRNERRQSIVNPRVRRAAIETLEQRMLLSAGDLDPTFGVGGKVTTDFQGGGFNAFMQQVAVQSDGKTVAVGSMQHSNSNNFAVARFNPDGSLDAAFGTNGTLTTEFGGDDRGNAIAIQADGKIIAAGSRALPDFSKGIALSRYNPDGSLDQTFGIGGMVTTVPQYVTPEVQANAVAVQSDGKIVVAGHFGSNSGGTAQIALARYNPDGTLDASFGSNISQPGLWWHGNVQNPFFAEVRAHSLVIQPDGKYVDRRQRRPRPPARGAI